MAELVLAKFFEIRDAVAQILNPFSQKDEGSTRERGNYETQAETDILNRGFIVIERYTKRETVFAEFNTLKYRFMASFGPETEEIFLETNKTVHSIFSSARILATHYWKRQGRVHMEGAEFQKHLDEMHKHEGIFWETGDENDEIKLRLNAIQAKLEAAVAPCFKEPISLYTLFTKRWQ